MKDKIVISGATGFVGLNLTTYFLDKNYEVNLIVRPDSNLSKLSLDNSNLKVFIYENDLNSLIAFFKGVNPICTFHLASNFIAEHQPLEIDSLVSSNISFGLHVLEAMKEANVKTLINTGTSWQHYNNEEYNPVCLYAATKQAFESLIEYYVKAENFKVITLKLFDTYGETDTRSKLINLLNKFANEQIELILSPGDQIINLVYINDICLAFETAMKLISFNKEGGTHLKYVVKDSKSYSLKEVIDIFEMVAQKKLNIIWGGKSYRKREVMEIWEQGQILPNWFAETSLEEGLKKIISKDS
jgi:nucleoside-diphosphate-sugar epimerase